MKTPIQKYTTLVVVLLLLLACSTKKNNFLSRNSHALSTKYNILYNGQISLDKGLLAIQEKTQDNFWKRLPIEKMQFVDEKIVGDTTKNPDFKRAEDKATKAIQKHSMNINGNEKNFQTDEAYLMLGKARYYDQRFLPALDAFNYILYKYPESSTIYEAKIWREKTNMRLDNEALAIKNIKLMLHKKKVSSQTLANASALLSEAYLKLEQKDSALIQLKIAEKHTQINTEKARYRFILGQLYSELGKNDSAIQRYDAVIAMNRRADRVFFINAQAKKAELFDHEKGDTLVFLKTFDKLIENRENKPFLGLLLYEKALFYDLQNNPKAAFKYYNQSLKTGDTDKYLNASSYRNIGNRFFKNANYPIAAKYYDSTLVNMEPKTKEYIHFKKKRSNLDEVIKYEIIAKRNDSILNLVALSDGEKAAYFENYIKKIKKIDADKKALVEKQKQIQENIARNTATASGNDLAASGNSTMASVPAVLPGPPVDQNDGARFYFYNASLVSYGKIGFKKNWGNRAAIGYWRVTSIKLGTSDADANRTAANDADVEPEKVEEKVEEKYTIDFYQNQLPTNPKIIDSIATERNTVYYRLGVIYKEKFKEYGLATDKLENLLQNKPDPKLIIPTKYNLFKIYEITNPEKALVYKNSILADYPDSRYAQVIRSGVLDHSVATANDVYNSVYRLYQQAYYTEVIVQCEKLIIEFAEEEIVSKFELLKAIALAKTQGLAAYKNALQNIVTVYPDSDEGKKAQEILSAQIPLLDQLAFNKTDKKNWKVIFRIKKDADTRLLEKNLTLFINENYLDKLFYSCDNYDDNEYFIVLQSMKTEAYAKAIVYEFCANKKYKSPEPAVAISSENYEVLHIKKNIDAYIAQ